MTSGCIEAKRTGQAGDVITGDTQLDTSGDTFGDTSPDTVGGCPELCDDLNPCTEDRCDELTGLCVFTPLPSFEAIEPFCTDAESCDDTDACTEDFCIIDGCSGASVCDNVPIEGCESCVDNSDCHSDDPCLISTCDPSGQCVLEPIGFPVNAIGFAGECFDDSDCNDDDACTVDVCETDECSAFSFCRFDEVPGCFEGCNPDSGGPSCDDGNPCTTDTCTPFGECVFEAAFGCVPECSGLEAHTVGDTVFDSSTHAGLYTVEGRAGLSWFGQSCDDGPDCRCESGVSLKDSGDELELLPGATGIADWTCEQTGCVAPVKTTCAPLQAGPTYWVWGVFANGLTPLTLPADNEPTEVPVDAPPTFPLQVDGFCLATTPAGLPGLYEGIASLDNHSSPVDARISYDGGSFSVSWQDPCPPGAPCVAPVLQSIVTPAAAGDGYLEVVLPVDGAGGSSIRLYANRNLLAGRTQLATVIPEGLAGELTITLARVGD